MAYMKDSTGRRLDSFKAISSPEVGERIVRANTIAWLGDSHTANGGGYTTPGQTGIYNTLGFWVHAQSILSHRLRTVKNAGVAGQRTDEILARVPDVLALNPGWCHVLAGTNDVTQAVSVATIKSNLTQIWDAFDAAAIRVVAGTIPPRSTWGGSQLSDTLELNAWILDQGRRRRNLAVVDYFTVLTGQGGNTYWANMTTDGLHMSATGASYAGAALASVLAPLVPASPASIGLRGNLLPNGPLANGGAGSVPSGWLWSGGTAPTYSRVARTDPRAPVGGPGWQRLVVADGVTGIFQTNTSGMTGISTGDLIVAFIRYRMSGLQANPAAHAQYLTARLGAYNGSSFTDWAWDAYFQTGYGNLSNRDRDGAFLTPPLVVPPGSTQLALQVQIGSGGTFDFAEAAAYNLTALGLAA